ncbi:MAG: AAA family ATPase [Clostridia bacterium]|nr:AAA family ATPase [Clostridia bacterium]
MLKSIEINNFKSFKNKTKIDLEKTNYQMLSSTNVTNHLLKGIMFVGANASGKSNSILTVKFLLDCLFGKQHMNMLSYVCMFSNEPTMELKYTFEIDNEEIQYCISFQRINNMISEKLILSGNTILNREGKYAQVEIKDKSQHEDVPDNVLFLRDVYFSTKFRGNEILQKWFDFLSNSIYLDLYRKTLLPYRDIDLSVKNYMENGGEQKINDFFDKYNFEQCIEYDKDSAGPTVSVHADEKMIYFKRKGIEDPIPYSYESTGNRNLIHLLPSFFSCIENSGLLLLDEFSSGFHNDLEELLIRYFMQNATNSQMLFVSHSTNLLSNSLLRPDQIYSVDFDNNGSHLKRFSSEKPREAQNLEKMYLSGIFNGVPRYENNA